MAEIKGNGRFVKLSKEERALLITQIGFRGTVRVSKWENYGKTRMYVEIGRDKSYLNLSDETDLELGFNDPASGLAVVALLAELEAEAAAKIAAEVEIEVLPEVPAPTIEQVQELSDALGSSTPHENPEIRVLQFKAIWQQIVVEPAFHALAQSAQTPHAWNEICLGFDAEWSRLERQVAAGITSWSDHLVALKEKRAVRA